MAYYKVDSEIFLSPLYDRDVSRLVEFLNVREIFNNTLTIPYPYTKKDGEDFIKHCKKKKKYGKNVNWAIRDKNKNLIGGCGFLMKYKSSLKRDEIGYWLAKPYWNKGIMTKVVRKLCDIGFKKFKLERIEAAVFIHNDASCRVLEKAGFNLKGVHKKSVKKKKKLTDIKLFTKEFY